MTELLARILAGLSLVAAIVSFGIGIWAEDGRWYGTGVLFGVVFAIGVIVAANTDDVW